MEAKLLETRKYDMETDHMASVRTASGVALTDKEGMVGREVEIVVGTREKLKGVITRELDGVVEVDFAEAQRVVILDKSKLAA